eukprot:scaffold71808_cov69-Phaeocystis_antarctica.AAC.5
MSEQGRGGGPGGGAGFGGTEGFGGAWGITRGGGGDVRELERRHRRAAVVAPRVALATQLAALAPACLLSTREPSGDRVRVRALALKVAQAWGRRKLGIDDVPRTDQLSALESIGEDLVTDAAAVDVGVAEVLPAKHARVAQHTSAFVQVCHAVAVGRVHRRHGIGPLHPARRHLTDEDGHRQAEAHHMHVERRVGVEVGALLELRVGVHLRHVERARPLSARLDQALRAPQVDRTARARATDAMAPRAHRHEMVRVGVLQPGSNAIDEGLELSHREPAARLRVIDAEARLALSARARERGIAKVGARGATVRHRCVEDALGLVDHLVHGQALVAAQRRRERLDRVVHERVEDDVVAKEVAVIVQLGWLVAHQRAVEEDEDDQDVVVGCKLEHSLHGLDDTRFQARDPSALPVVGEDLLRLLAEPQPYRVAAVLLQEAHGALGAAVRAQRVAILLVALEVDPPAHPREVDAVEEERLLLVHQLPSVGAEPHEGVRARRGGRRRQQLR